MAEAKRAGIARVQQCNDMSNPCVTCFLERTPFYRMLFYCPNPSLQAGRLTGELGVNLLIELISPTT
jgi:hypothetical protein